MARFCALVAVALLLSPPCLGMANGADDLPETIEFNRDIRPILSNTCFACHGPDEDTREAKLRLDQEEPAKSDRGGYFAIASGKPDDSELIFRITSDDPDEQMPPPDALHQLKPRQIALLKKWIAQGAEWQDHWAMIAPSKADPPKVEPLKVAGASDWSVHPVDRFLLRNMRIRGVEPSPKADRRLLIRRLFFDVTGLPPTPAQVEAFVNDKSSDAYEKLVDQLLADQAFGERMATYWLDVVRYADTSGIHGDQPIPISPYRDYVISAFNKNLPFDQFVREQLAGDLIKNATIDQRVASGFNRLNMMTSEGGAQPKEYLAKYAADRVRNTATIFLGATIGCAECHDHKFDPYSAKDFYSFAAFFADLSERGVYGGSRWTPTLSIPNAENAPELERLVREIAQLEQRLKTSTPALIAAQNAWEKQLAAKSSVWHVLQPKSLRAAGGTKLDADADGTIVATEAAVKDTYEITAAAPANITAVQLELLPDASLPAKGPGMATNGNFVLNEFEVYVGDKKVTLSHAASTHSQQGYVIKSAIDGNPATGWATLPRVGQPNTAVFTLAEPLALSGKNELRFKLVQTHGSRHLVGRFRIALTDQPPELVLGDKTLPPAIAAILNLPSGKRDAAQLEQVAAHYRSIAPTLVAARDQLAKSQQAHKALSTHGVRSSLVSVAVKPRTMRILPRGNWLDDTGAVVTPDTPDSMFKLDVKDRQLTRMDLANWLVDSRQPKTSRAMVNRLWKLYFGRGIASTLDDLGTQGSAPQHPELLDWLAVDFYESGWDIKRMVKQLVMTEAYQQTSLPRDNLRELDPFNTLLARQGRFRLPAEVVRDNALATSGLLVRKLGGPSVRPYQPPGYWKHLNFPKRSYQQSKGEDLYRRSVYTHWQRQYLHPAMLAFDAPSREECTVERPRSNTPLQALVLLNDPQFVEAARVLAAETLQKAQPTAEARLDYMFSQVLTRKPNDEERRILLSLRETHQKQFAEQPAEATKLTSIGSAPRVPGLDPAEWAAWTSVARTIYNLQETINRY